MLAPGEETYCNRVLPDHQNFDFLTDSAERAVVGLVGALAIAVFSRSRRALTGDGAIAATVLGSLAAAAGWEWAALLIAFFVTGTLFSRMSVATKAAHTAGITEKGGQRDFVQVLANGGLFGLLAVCSVVYGSDLFIIPAAGAIAAATSDTWATEIGTAASGRARSILGFGEVQAGTSGAISGSGTIAAVAGAIFIAGVALAFGGAGDVACAAIIGGIGGSFLDSIAGATVQSQRWCAQCGMSTERMTHTCGQHTTHQRGVSWLDNDGVNALATVGGAAIGALCLL